MAGMSRIACLLGFVVALVGCNSGSGSVTAAPFSGAVYNGVYAGQWNNATFSTTGGAKITIAANDATKSGNVRWDFDGNVLGQGNPAEENFDVTYSDDGLTFGGTSPSFGNFTMTIGRNGSITGVANNPNALITRVSFTGQATSTAITLNYQVQFSAAGGGGTANGTVNLTKQ